MHKGWWVGENSEGRPSGSVVGFDTKLSSAMSATHFQVVGFSHSDQFISNACDEHAPSTPQQVSKVVCVEQMRACIEHALRHSQQAHVARAWRHTQHGKIHFKISVLPKYYHEQFVFGNSNNQSPSCTPSRDSTNLPLCRKEPDGSSYISVHSFPNRRRMVTSILQLKTT